MIKDIRVVEWEEGRFLKQTRWDIQIKRDGSNKWESLPYTKVKRKPQQVAWEKQK
jgi:hypothetical protein